MNKAYLFVIAVLALSLIAPNPGHPASQVGPGTFASGDFTFPGQLTVDGNFIINTETLFVNTTTQRIGIGTTTPTQTLDVRGSINISNTIITSEICLGGVCETVWPSGSSIWTDNNGNATFTTGNVGIGTTTPQTTLDINGSIRQQTTTPEIIYQFNNTNTTNSPQVRYHEGYIYLASRGSNRINIFEASNPRQPRLINHIPTDIWSLELRGNYLYTVGAGSESFKIIDITDKTNPQTLHTSNNPGGKLTVEAGYAYITNRNEDTLTILDIHNPHNVQTKAQLNLSNLSASSSTWTGSVRIRHNIAFVSSMQAQEIAVVNITDKSNPQILTIINDTGRVWDLQVEGNYLYTAPESTSELRIYDISDLSSIEQVGSVAVGGSPQDIVVAHNLVYVTSFFEDRISVVDVTNRSNPFVLHQVTDDSLDGVAGLDIAGNYLVAASWNAGALTVLDLGGTRLPTASIGSAYIGQLTTNNIRTSRNIHAGGSITAHQAHIRNSLGVAQDISVGGSITAQTLQLNTTQTMPSCAQSTRGTLWFEQREGSDDDRLFTCMRNSTDAYNWVLVARGE